MNLLRLLWAREVIVVFPYTPMPPRDGYDAYIVSFIEYRYTCGDGVRL